MRAGLPNAVKGQRIGLLGGSFDPPHAGHVHISKEALKRFGLDRVWWLVSPGNPLKAEGPAPLARRLAACRALVDHPRIAVTDFEARSGTRYTAETLAALFEHYPGVDFVWLMGADNLAGFHRWQNWQWIMHSIPLGVLARTGEQVSTRMSPAPNRFRRFRLPAQQARALASCATPVWCFLNVPMIDISSTRIRKRGDWTK